jgi:hypothetical protein
MSPSVSVVSLSSALSLWLPDVFVCFFFLVCFLLGFFFFVAVESAEDSALLLSTDDGLSLLELLLGSGLRFFDFFFFAFSLLFSPFSLEISLGGGFLFLDFFAFFLVPSLHKKQIVSGVEVC